MRTTFLVLSFIFSISLQAMEMQHGFILRGRHDGFASHLVATGHHSRQVDVLGELIINDPAERDAFETRKKSRTVVSYFLFQAQKLNLDDLNEGDRGQKYYELEGHIVESPVGDYTPKNIIVKSAIYRVHNVLINLVNPFFGDDSHN
jgi:hypothetical protein